MAYPIFSQEDRETLRIRGQSVLAECLKHWRGKEVAEMIGATQQFVTNCKAGRQYLRPADIAILLNKLEAVGITPDKLPNEQTVTQTQMTTISNASTEFGARRYRDALLSRLLACNDIDEAIKMIVIKMMMATPLNGSANE
jgi:hypothetical protein